MAKNVETTETGETIEAAPKAPRTPRVPRPKYVAIRVTDENGNPVNGAQLEVVGFAKESDGLRTVLDVINLSKQDTAVIAFAFDSTSFKAV